MVLGGVFFLYMRSSLECNISNLALKYWFCIESYCT